MPVNALNRDHFSVGISARKAEKRSSFLLRPRKTILKKLFDDAPAASAARETEAAAERARDSAESE